LRMTCCVSSFALNRFALAKRGATIVSRTQCLRAGETHHSPAAPNDWFSMESIAEEYLGRDEADIKIS